MCLGPELILKSCLTNRMIIFKSFEEHLESITQTLINVKYIPTYNNYDKMNMKKKKKTTNKKALHSSEKGTWALQTKLHKCRTILLFSYF